MAGGKRACDASDDPSQPLTDAEKSNARLLGAMSALDRLALHAELVRVRK